MKGRLCVKKHTPVEITWVDSKGTQVVWQWKDDFDEDIATITSVGYLIKRNKDITIICQSISEDQYGKVFRIPTVAVKSIKELK